MSKKRNAEKAAKPTIKKFKLSELHEATHNKRQISDEALAGLAASLERFGLVEPIVVNTKGAKNVIVGGHQRLKALRQLYGPGTECICMAVYLDPVSEQLLNVTLNNAALRAEWTAEAAAEIARLQEAMKGGVDFYRLRVDKLRQELEQTEPATAYKVEKLKPFNRVHVLLSFSPELLADLSPVLQTLVRTAGVEYEQSSN